MMAGANYEMRRHFLFHKFLSFDKVFSEVEIEAVV